jgi:hypothetical protein
MRQRLMQVLASDDDREAETIRSDAIVRRFWARGEPRPDRKARPAPGRVIDMAQWARAHGKSARA